MHYKPMPQFNEADIRRFWENVDQKMPDDCWVWKLAVRTGGYGSFKCSGRGLIASRVAYYLFYHADPSDKMVCHTCDFPNCCNPYHLFLGTALDNSQDAQNKGRLKHGEGDRHGSKTHPEKWYRGEQSAASKLTEEQVLEIRRAYKVEFVTQQQLADRYGTKRETIGRIIRGDNWLHVALQDEQVSLTSPMRRGKPGSLNLFAKLNDEKVREIRRLHTEGLTGVQIAARFDVTNYCISDILRGKSWKHVV